MARSAAEFAVYVIGQTTLPVQCCEILRERGHRVLGVISDDVTVADWARARGVACHAPDQPLTPLLAAQPYDLLLSIVNPLVLSEEALATPRRMAINYHDALLPAHAGVHATSWALMNGDREHGVTWHEMTRRIDAGRLLVQAPIQIARGETVESLDRKCHAAAIDSFMRLLDGLEQGRLEALPESTRKRSYHGRTKRPPSGGLVPFDRGAEAAARFVAALQFGRRFNPLGSPKLLHDGALFLVGAVESLASAPASPGTAAPGTLLAVDELGLDVSTSDMPVRLTGLSTIDGAPLSGAGELRARGFVEGVALRCLEQERAQRLEELSTRAARHEPRWIARYRTFAPAAPRDQVPRAASASARPLARARVAVDIGEPHDPRLAYDAFAVAVIAAYEMRRHGGVLPGLGVVEPRHLAELQGLEAFFATSLPFHPEADLTLPWTAFAERASGALRALGEHGPCFRDLAPRLRMSGAPTPRELPVSIVLGSPSNELDVLHAPLTFWVDRDERLVWLASDEGAGSGQRAEDLAPSIEAFAASLRARPERPVASANLLPAPAWRRIVHDWNQTAVPFDERLCAHQLLEARAAEFPDRIALVHGEDRLSYAELDARADRLARRLRSLGVGREALVGVCLGKTIEGIVAFWACLKAGGAYLPLDPALPAERLRVMVEDANVAVLLAREADADRFAGSGPRPTLWSALERAVDSGTELGSELECASDQLAYVIYTSGSTGRPKGVLLTHRGLVNLALEQIKGFGVHAASRVLQFAALSFDASISEIVMAHGSGAALHLPPPDAARDPRRLLDVLARDGITHATFPPSFLLALEPESLPACLHTLIVAGEACPRELVARFARDRRLINAYGPTEITVCATLGDCRPEDEIVSIGRPIGNVQVYVLDPYLNPVPPGEIGEIYVSGVGLARGYLGRPESEAEHFLDNPFASGPSAAAGAPPRLYRTGDLARQLDDGRLVFAGRRDRQLKLRGHRIEPDEVEAHLEDHPRVRGAAVFAAGEHHQRRLLAYVQSRPFARGLELWPSTAEFYVYDDILYTSLSKDHRRNDLYRAALRRVAAGKIVVEVGTGKDAILARLAVEAGASRVYAVEKGAEAAAKALETVRRLGLEDRIVVIHGDATSLELPEKGDVHLSEIVGPIGGCEGAAAIVNATRRWVREGAAFIPCRATTRIAAVSMPGDLLEDPHFKDVPAHYLRKIFAEVGHPFDVRICVKGTDASLLVSTADVFEDLCFDSEVPTASDTAIRLDIKRDAPVHGFLLWLNLFTAEDVVIDTLEHEYSWLPVFLPVFPGALHVRAGDRIEMRCARRLCENGLNPDFHLEGRLLRSQGDPVPFRYDSHHFKAVFRHNDFYRRLFDERGRARGLADHQDALREELQAHLASTLPGYMMPDALRIVDALPLTHHGKKDYATLLEWERDRGQQKRARPRQDGTLSTVTTVLSEALGHDRIHPDDNFFDIGVNSLLLLKISTSLERRFGVRLSQLDVLEHATPRRLADHIARLDHGEGHAAQADAAAVTSMRDGAARPGGAPGGHEPIAIVGMACRFPGADDVESFWRNLCGGVESIGPQADVDPTPRDERAHPQYVDAAAPLSDIESFDHGYFGYSPREAALLDPQHRLFLEQAVVALESAGHGAGSRDDRIGVFAGCGLNYYFLNNLYPNRELLEEVGLFPLAIANDKDFLSTRVAYKLHLDGPAVTVQTACSTSLVAIHLAIQALRRGECDLAVAGGVSIQVPHRRGYRHRDGMITSADGHCRPFDADANGTIIGNGVGVVVLRRLSRARADGDPIRALILGSAVNNDGDRKAGYTAPSVEGQTAVISRSLAEAGVPRSSLCFVETHGTGTALGDPIEIRALANVFAGTPFADPGLILGALKANIGHADTAAGVAGVIKAALVLERRKIPPVIHFSRANPELDLDRARFHFNERLVDLSDRPGPLHAGVSSFGIGGTNAHVTLGEAAGASAASQGSEGGGAPCEPQLLALSAHSPESLERMALELAGWLSERGTTRLDDLAFTLNVGRKTLPHRLALVAQDAGEAAAALRAGAVLAASSARADERTRLALLFTGQGSQYLDMAGPLYRSEPQFRAHVDACAALMEPHLGEDIRASIFVEGSPAAAAALKRTSHAQPALFALHVSLARLLLDWGMPVAAMLGHSLGELSAACVAGVFSLADAAALVCARGRLMQAQRRGGMLAVFAEEARIEPLLGRGLSLAAVNAPASLAVSGSEEDLRSLQVELDQLGIGHAPLSTSHAFHSADMDPAMEPLRREVATVERSRPRIPFISCLTGDWITEDEACSPDYWAAQMRRPVRFAEGLRTLAKLPDLALVEVGPGTQLSSLAKACLGAGCAPIVSTLPHRDKRDRARAHFLQSLGQLWQLGAPIDGRARWSGQRHRRLSLPSYPFARHRHWIDPPADSSAGRSDTSPRRAASDVSAEPRFFQPVWQPTSFDVGPVAPGGAGPTLLIAPRGHFYDALQRRIERSGTEVIQIEPADTHRQTGARRFNLEIGSEPAWRRWFDDRARAGLVPPARIVLAGDFDGDSGDQARLDDPRGAAPFRCALALARVLGDGEAARRGYDMLLLTHRMFDLDGGDACHPLQALAQGPIMSIPREYPHLRCRLLDLGFAPGDTGPRPKALEKIARLILGEPPEWLLALRGDRLFGRRFEPLAEGASGGPAIPLRGHGVYLLTGGLGGVALALAGAIAEQVPAKLVLLSRTAAPPRERRAEWLASGDEKEVRRARAVQELEARGAEVHCVAVDVADPRAMRAVVSDIEDRLGAVTGLVHAAGLPAAGSIHLKGAEMARGALRPKVEGARVLYDLFHDRDLDFWLNCSSLASLLPDAGQADYAAANAFLDAFSAWANQRLAYPVVSLNWDSWRDAGMHHDWLRSLDPARRERERPGAIGDAQGKRAFLALLRRPRPQLAFSAIDLSRPASADRPAREPAREAAPSSEPQRSVAPRHERPPLAARYAPPRTATQERLVCIWQDVMGVEPVGIHDSFLDLGGDSMLATQVISRVKQAFGISMAMNRVLSTDIEGFAEHLDRVGAPEGRSMEEGLI
ncbi:amino acid adenylation domain-containing protein [Sorangium sp. So ce134]